MWQSHRWDFCIMKWFFFLRKKQSEYILQVLKNTYFYDGHYKQRLLLSSFGLGWRKRSLSPYEGWGLLSPEQRAGSLDVFFVWEVARNVCLLLKSRANGQATPFRFHQLMQAEGIKFVSLSRESQCGILRAWWSIALEMVCCLVGEIVKGRKCGEFQGYLRGITQIGPHTTSVSVSGGRAHKGLFLVCCQYSCYLYFLLSIQQHLLEQIH